MIIMIIIIIIIINIIFINFFINNDIIDIIKVQIYQSTFFIDPTTLA